MCFMNEFVVDEIKNMKEFIKKISVSGKGGGGRWRGRDGKDTCQRGEANTAFL